MANPNPHKRGPTLLPGASKERANNGKPVSRLGYWLLTHPIIAMLMTAFAVIAPQALSAFGATQWIVEQSLGSPEEYLPNDFVTANNNEQAPQPIMEERDQVESEAERRMLAFMYRFSSKFISFASFEIGLAFSFLLGLAEALLLIFGLSEKYRRDTELIIERNHHDRELFDKYRRNATQESVEAINEEFHRAFDTIIPISKNISWSSPIREECIEVAASVARILNGETEEETSDEQLVIRRGLVRGFRARLEERSRSLAKLGAFMDVEERRVLTDELVKITGSYSVVVTSLHAPKMNTTLWNKEYFKIIDRLHIEMGRSIPWIFVPDEPIPDRGLNHVIETLPNSVEPYIVEDLSKAQGSIRQADIEDFFQLGVLIEIFDQILVPSDNGDKKLGNVIAWKSTSFCIRAGEHVSIDNAKTISLKSAIEFAQAESGQSVWACKEIAKLVRAGVVRERDGSWYRVLKYISENAVSLSPTVRSNDTHANDIE